MARSRRSRWPWLSLLPFGLGSWAPMFAGVRCGVQRWTAFGVLWSILAVAGWVIASVEPSTSTQETVAVLLLSVAWIGGVVTSFAIRAEYERRAAERPAAVARPAGLCRSRWPWLSLLPLGLGSWTPILAGVRCGVRSWTALGVLWSALALAGWAIAVVSPSASIGASLVSGLMVVAWIGGMITSFAICPEYERRVGTQSRERASWPTPTLRSRRWSIRYALTAYAITFVGVNAVAAALYFGLGIHLRVGAGVLFVDASLLVSLMPLKRQLGLAPQDLGLRTVPATRSIGFVSIALVAYILIAWLWIAAVHPHGAASTLADVKHQSTVNLVLAIIAVAASAPIVEEIFFRGLLYRSLRNRFAVLPAAIIAGGLFGLVHITSYPLGTLPIKAAFGIIACILYERTGSLLPGIGLHSFVDASSIDFSLTGNDLIVLASFSAIVLVLLIHAAAVEGTTKARPSRLAVLGDQHDAPTIKARPPAKPSKAP